MIDTRRTQNILRALNQMRVYCRKAELSAEEQRELCDLVQATESLILRIVDAGGIDALARRRGRRRSAQARRRESCGSRRSPTPQRLPPATRC